MGLEVEGAKRRASNSVYTVEKNENVIRDLAEIGVHNQSESYSVFLRHFKI